MKRTAAVLAFAAFSALLLNAQFGGLINKAKDKMDGAKQKAKPVSDRAERAVDNFTLWTAEEEQEIGEATATKMVAMFGAVDTAQAGAICEPGRPGCGAVCSAAGSLPFRDSRFRYRGRIRASRRFYLHHQDRARGDEERSATRRGARARDGARLRASPGIRDPRRRKIPPGPSRKPNRKPLPDARSTFGRRPTPFCSTCSTCV